MLSLSSQQLHPPAGKTFCLRGLANHKKVVLKADDGLRWSTKAAYYAENKNNVQEIVPV